MSSEQRPGDRTGLGVFGHYTRELHRYLLRRLRRPEDVDDLAQEVYLRLLRMNQDRLIQKPLAYLYGIASHVVAEFHNARAHEQTLDGVDAELLEPSDEDRLAERLNLQQQLQRALAQLPPTHAAVLLAHKRDGLSYEEVARELNLSVHTVAIYIKQAKARIRMMEWER